MSLTPPSPVDPSHNKSPRDPMTSGEREAVREEMQDEMAALSRHFAEHGGPWDDFRAN